MVETEKKGEIVESKSEDDIQQSASQSRSAKTPVTLFLSGRWGEQKGILGKGEKSGKQQKQEGRIERQ